MELWLLSAILGTVLWAISSTIDKQIVNKTKPLSTTTLKMLFNFSVLVLYSFGVLRLIPSWKFLIYSMVLGSLWAGSALYYFKLMKLRDASFAMPYMQGITVLLSFILAGILFSEKVSFFNILGVILISLGVFELLERKISRKHHGNKLFLYGALNVGFVIMHYMIAKVTVDGFNPVLSATWMYFFATLTMWIVLLSKKKVEQIKEIPKIKLLISSIFGACGTMFFYWALSKGNATKVLPLEGIQSAIMILLAILFLKEKMTKQRFIATALIVLGIYLIGS